MIWMKISPSVCARGLAGSGELAVRSGVGRAVLHVQSARWLQELERAAFSFVSAGAHARAVVARPDARPMEIVAAHDGDAMSYRTRRRRRTRVLREWIETRQSLSSRPCPKSRQKSGANRAKASNAGFQNATDYIGQRRPRRPATQPKAQCTAGRGASWHPRSDRRIGVRYAGDRAVGTGAHDSPVQHWAQYSER